MEREVNNVEQEFIQKQKQLCKKYDAEYVAAPFESFIGIGFRSFENPEMPINGLRHPDQSEHTVNWYIWAGEYSDAGDFFQPIHIRHLLQICPLVIPYLGLGPGWRFLFDNKYEDVWFDESLLNI